jgi:predicted thioesterase
VPIEPGASATWQVRVEPSMTADKWGNPGVQVLATPYLVGLFEGAAVRAIKDQLQPGQSSVGTHVDIRHLKATPVGDTITLTAEVITVDGRRVNFRVRAEDSGGLAGEGTHERVLIDLERFMQRVGTRTLESG